MFFFYLLLLPLLLALLLLLLWLLLLLLLLVCNDIKHVLSTCIRGNSKYHYYGLRIKAGSSLLRLMEDQQHLAMRQQPFSQKQRYLYKQPHNSAIGGSHEYTCSAQGFKSLFHPSNLTSTSVCCCSGMKTVSGAWSGQGSKVTVNFTTMTFFCILTGWSLCIKLKGWPTALQQAQASSSNSSKGQDRWTSAHRFSSTSSSWVSSANRKLLFCF